MLNRDATEIIRNLIKTTIKHSNKNYSYARGKLTSTKNKAEATTVSVQIGDDEQVNHK